MVDDYSQDNTGHVAREYGVDVLRPPRNPGSKARAQNYALPYCTTDLVLPVDADTILAPDYVERRERPRQQLITLITCTPVTLAFTPYRIIVTGRLVSVTKKGAASSGSPAAHLAGAQAKRRAPQPR